MSLPVRWGPMAMYNGVFPFGPDVRELEAALLNAQRTVQAFRVLLKEAQKLNTTLTEKLRSHQRMAASGVYIKTAEYAAECSERRDLRRQLEEMTKDRDAQRIAWNAAESEMWLGELREQLATVTEERDRAAKLMGRAIHLLDECKAPSKGHEGDCSANTECDGRCSNQAAWIADYCELIQQAEETK